MSDQVLIDEIIHQVRNELHRAQCRFGPMHSPHEGCAVIREEFEELWDAVKAHHSNVPTVEMCNEAVQVAAMAIRFLHDITPGFFRDLSGK